MSECEGKGKEWLRELPGSWLGWIEGWCYLLRKAHIRRSRLAGEYHELSFEHADFEMCVTHLVGLFHVDSWICCTGKREIQISNFSPRRKQLLKKVGLK